MESFGVSRSCSPFCVRYLSSVIRQIESDHLHSCAHSSQIVCRFFCFGFFEVDQTVRSVRFPCEELHSEAPHHGASPHSGVECDRIRVERERSGGDTACEWHVWESRATRKKCGVQRVSVSGRG